MSCQAAQFFVRQPLATSIQPMPASAARTDTPDVSRIQIRVKTARTTEVKLKQNSLETILKLFVFVSAKTKRRK